MTEQTKRGITYFAGGFVSGLIGTCFGIPWWQTVLVWTPIYIACDLNMREG